MASTIDRWSRRGLILLAGCALAALVTDSRAATVKAQTQITASEDLNPNYVGRPSPVSLTIYQLVSADKFNSTTYFPLESDETAVLGGDLIKSTQRMLHPGETVEFEVEFDEEARFVGIVAAYRDIVGAQWRTVVELPQKGLFGRVFSRSKMFIDLQSLAVEAEIK